MGSHRARHRSDRNPAEELATELLARLAAEARTEAAPRRGTTPAPTDPFTTAPFPARPPRPTAPSRPASASRPGRHQAVLQAGTGATRCGGTADPHGHPLLHGPLLLDRPAGLDTDTVGRAVDTAGREVVRPAPDVATALGTGPRAALTVAAFVARRSFAAHDFVAGLDGPLVPPLAPFPIAPTAGGRLRTRPLYAAVSVTVISATAAVAASAGPAVFTAASAAPDLTARSAALASGAAADFALSTGPTTARQAAGPTATPTTPPAPVQGSTIVAQTTAATKTHGPGPTSTPTATPTAPTSTPTTTPAPTTPPTTTTAPTTTSPTTTSPRTTTPQTTAPPSTPPQTTAPRPAPAPRSAPAPAPATAAPRPVAPAATAGHSVGARALALAEGKLGAPYVWGATGPNAFDCSGLVVWAYRQLGLSLPHSSGALSTMGAPVAQSALQPGDLVFFYSPVSHVGIYAGNGMVINATQTGHPVQYTKLAYLPFHNARRITG